MTERGARATVPHFKALLSEESGGTESSGFVREDEARTRERKALLRTLCIDATQRPRPRGLAQGPTVADGFRALASGRYALTDHFEDGETRLLIAVRVNDEEAEAPARLGGREADGGLSIRETQVAAYVACGFPLKVVAYELGISVASAGRASFAALKKLGLRSRVELAARLQPFLCPLP